MPTRPTLRQLEYAVAVSDERSFQRAAKACAVSQPGLSAQLQQLESLLEVRLFERDRRRVLPTPAGEEIVQRARELLAGCDDLLEAARIFARPLSGRLRLGVIPTVSPYLLPRALPNLRRRFPALRLELREERTPRLVELLEEAGLDLLLLALEASLGDVATRPLFRDPFVVALPRGHRLAKRKSLREAEIAGEPVLLLEDGHCLRDQALAVCQEAGAEESATFRATSLTTLVQMVASGAGITLLPRLALGVERLAPDVVTVPLRRPAPHRTIGLAWRRTSPRGDEYETLAEALEAAAGPAGGRARS